MSTNCHTFVRTEIKLSAKICQYCTANAVIYQWDKWLCFKHWKIERDKEEKKRGLAAKDWLINILESAQTDIEMQSHGVGKYGRVLGVLYINDVNINDLMVKEGHAEVYDGGKR